MDFEMHYTKEQEEFRKEVRSWLQANTRQDMKMPVDPSKQTREQYDHSRQLRRKLGEKGWLAPLYPKEYGGGGLTVAEAIIIEEELAEHEAFLPYDSGMIRIVPALTVWGTEEQKRRFLPPILTGEVISWQGFTEPDAGTDLASLKMRAEKDGDDFILNGQKIYIGSDYDVDWLYTLAVTDPTKPRHNNIGAFIVPATTPGVTIKPMQIIVGKTKNTIFYDNVRVSRSNMIGSETDGWRAAQSTLEFEHGGAGSPIQKDAFVDGLLDFCRQKKRGDQPLSKYPEVRNALVDIWIGAQVQRLFELRNYWMRTARIRWAWEGSQNSLFDKVRQPRVAQQVLSILGPYVLTDDPEWKILEGQVAFQQADSILTHPGGTPEAQKIIMARRIGIARTRQGAASMG